MHILAHSNAKLVIQYRPYISWLTSGAGCLVALLVAVAVVIDFQVYGLVKN